MIIPYIPTSIDYNEDQFDMDNDELNISHFHTPDDRKVLLGIGTEDNPGTDSTFLGYNAGNTNTNELAGAGTNNTYVGSKCGVGTIRGSSYSSFANTGLGNKAMEKVAGSFRNLAAGYYALGELCVGSWSRNVGGYNVALGAFNSYNMKAGHSNMSQGYFALAKGEFVVQNVAIGMGSGENVSASGGSITSFVDAGGGKITVTATGHNRIDGDEVEICGTTNYNNAYIISGTVSGVSFEITETYVSDDATGYWYATDEGLGNTLVGNHVGGLLTTGNYNALLGYETGALLTTGDNNVLIGKNAGGLLTTESNRLYIHNSNTVNPLIYGEFDNSLLKINGDLFVEDDFTMLGDTLTIGDGSATDVSLVFNCSTNDGLVTYDESEDLFDFGVSDISTDGDLFSNSLILSVADQAYKFVNRADKLGMQSQDTEYCTFELYSKNGLGTGKTILNLFNKGVPDDISNYQILQIMMVGTNSCKLRTLGLGTGTLLPIIISSGLSDDQFVIAANGGLGFGESAPVANYAHFGMYARFDGYAKFYGGAYFYGISYFYSTANFTAGTYLYFDGSFALTSSGGVNWILAYDPIRIGLSSNYSLFGTNGDISFVGTAGLYPRRLNQSAEPITGTGSTQLDSKEFTLWRDSDDGKVYLVYNDETSGIKKVELT